MTTTTNAQTTSAEPATNGTPSEAKKVNRRTFSERLSDLSLEEKVAVIKELKGQVAEELAKREQSAKEAASLTQGL